MVDGWNENYPEQLKALGITCLYHVTDKDNLPSIVKERNLYSWKKLSMNGIAVTRPGGNAFTHRLDARSGMEDAVHLYACEPTEEALLKMRSSGQFSELCVLKVSLNAIHPEAAGDGKPLHPGGGPAPERLCQGLCLRRLWLF